MPYVFLVLCVLSRRYFRSDRHTDFLNVDKVKELYQPKSIIIEELINLPITNNMVEKNLYNRRDINALLSMHYKIQKCNELKSDYELSNNFKYDTVIRFRADIKLEENLNINPNLNNIHIPKYGDFLGVNDQLAYSNSQNMDTYCNLYQSINEYTEDIIVFNPEYFLKHHIMTNGLKVKRFPLEYKLACHCQLLDNQAREREWLSIRI